VSECRTVLYRGLWAQVLGALDPGTDLYAAVLAIAPPSWDTDLTDNTGDDTGTQQQIAGNFPGWWLWRPPSPDGTEPWWGARDGHTVIITSTAGELRAALTRQREGDTNWPPAEVFFFDRRRGS
jgi:hypothetical protein